MSHSCSGAVDDAIVRWYIFGTRRVCVASVDALTGRKVRRANICMPCSKTVGVVGLRLRELELGRATRRVRVLASW